jgi:hypothetical protein
VYKLNFFVPQVNNIIMSYYNASAGKFGNFGKNWTRALQRVVILGVCWCYEAETVIPLDKKGDMEEV